MHTLPYLEFQTAQARYQCAPAALDAHARKQVAAEALRQWQIEERILHSVEARGCPDDPVALHDAQEAIRQRYADHGSYLADLAVNGLDESMLTQALRRALQVERIMAQIMAAVPVVTEIETELFYWQHHKQFARPERRQARHILLTTVDAANRAKLLGLRTELRLLPEKQRAGRFAELALRYSECPTALGDGELGLIPHGVLYPEVEVVLFALPLGGINLAESPMGLHLVYCEGIQQAGLQPFVEVAASLREKLQEKRGRQYLKNWLGKQMPQLEAARAA